MPETEVDTFAGIDVSARELSVALRRGKGEDKPAMAKFSNHPSGHKALIAHLLRGGAASAGLPGGQRELQPGSGVDLASTPPSGDQCHQSAAGTALRGIARSAQQNRSGRCPRALRVCRSHALGCLATAQLSRSYVLAGCDACHCGLGGYPYSAEQSCARLRPRAKLCRSWWSEEMQRSPRNILSSA